MCKLLITLLFFLLSFPLTGTSYSAERDFDITVEYGPKLDRVSFKERYLFKRVMHTDWYRSTLEQRKEFLEQYHADLVAEKKRKKEAMIREKDKLKQIERNQKERKYAEKAKKLKEEYEERDAAYELKEQKQRELRKVKERERFIKELHSKEKKN